MALSRFTITKRSSVWWLGLCCVVCLFVVSVVDGVERSNFKTCKDSGFCRRHRALEAGPSPYVAVLDSLRVEDDKVSLQLLNTVTGLRLKASVTTYSKSTARLHITELNSIRERYEVPPGDVVLPMLDKQRPKIESKDERGVTLTAGDVTVAIVSKPFSVEFAVQDQPVVTINSRGLMKFEHFRRKSGLVQNTVASVQSTVSSFGSNIFSWLSAPFRTSETEEPKAEAVAAQESDASSAEDSQSGDADSAARSAADTAAPNVTTPLPEEEAGMWEETFKTHTDSKPYGPSSVGVDISFIGFQHLYGIPEHADSFALKSTRDTDPYRLYNLDVFEYELNNPMALYGSVPVMIAHSEKSTVGVFWQNPTEAWIDIASSTIDRTSVSRLKSAFGDGEVPKMDTHWVFESGVVDIFVMLGPQPADVSRQYAVLTGTTPLPPLFALAYHQSRWNYNDEADVQSVHDQFDKHDIPLDVIWLDIEHTDGKRYFTWDNTKFPHPEEMIHNLTARGRHLVAIVDPHIKRDDNYKIHKEARELDLYVKDKNGGEFEGWCWPGSSSYPDFVDPRVRSYWSSKFAISEYQGSTVQLFTWNDMNEPSVFNGPEITMPKDAKHHGDWEHREVHNLYGLYVHMATAQGQIDRSNGVLRPFVLSRAIFSGSQRWGAVWTGDNTGDWGHLKISIPMLLSLNMVGVTFCGADVGGFFRNSDAELMTRWYQAAAYQPFFRAHAHIDTRRREPWLLPEVNMRIIRAAIRDRYSLLPYWYTLFYHGEQVGGPIMRPLWVEFPDEKDHFAEQEEYMLGPALLVKPVTDQGAAGMNVYFPQRDALWYDVDTYAQYRGGFSVYIPTPLDKIPVFQRGGYIVPRRNRIRRSSTLTKNDPFTLVVALDRQGTAEGDLYMDDYTTFEYRQGQYLHRQFIFDQMSLQSREVVHTNFATAAWIEQVIIVGLDAQPTKVTVESAGHAGILEFDYQVHEKLLRIRKPAVNVADNWTIRIQ